MPHALRLRAAHCRLAEERLQLWRPSGVRHLVMRSMGRLKLVSWEGGGRGKEWRQVQQAAGGAAAGAGGRTHEPSSSSSLSSAASAPAACRLKLSEVSEGEGDGAGVGRCRAASLASTASASPWSSSMRCGHSSVAGVATGISGERSWSR